MPFSSSGVQVWLNETTENWEGKILKSNEKHQVTCRGKKKITKVLHSSSPFSPGPISVQGRILSLDSFRK